jgi:single-strand DNA-binding protein
MPNLNKVFLAGNLTRDPELRYTPGGTAVAQFSVAVNRRYKTREGQMQEEATFVDIEVWGRQAETSSEYLSKGSPVLIEGRLKLDSWESKQTGERRTKLRVVGERVQFLGRRSRGEDQGGPPGPPGERRRAPRPRRERPPAADFGEPGRAAGESYGGDEKPQGLPPDDDIPF